MIDGANPTVDDAPGLHETAEHLANHLQLALAAGDLGTWRWSIASGEVTWDENTERLFGLEPGGFDGTFEMYSSLLHPADREATLAVIREAVASKSPYSVEHRVVWPDGTVRWIRGRGAVMLGNDGEVLGTIGVSGDVTERKILDEDAAAQLEQARLRADLERLRRERGEFLAVVNSIALDAADHVEFMRSVAAAAVPHLGDWCTIHYLPEHETVPIVEVAHRDPAKADWVRELMERYPHDLISGSGVADVMRRDTSELVQIDEDTVGPFRLTSVVTVPLRTKRGIVGAMQLASAESGRRYDEEDVLLAETAAGRIAEALENTWLIGQLRGIASALQAALLPTGQPTIPGVSLAVRYWAAGTANEVGGDFYDAFQIGPARWAVAIGDVCGTGPAAAAVTAKARHTIRAAATHGTEHAEVLAWVNDAIIAGNRKLFCTLLYTTLEHHPAGDWEFTTAAAGHPLPIVVPANGEAHTVGLPGTLAGVLPKLNAHVTSTTLEPGDTVVMYTDGFTDVRPPHGLDDAAMLALVAKACSVDGEAEDVAGRIEEGAQEILPIAQRNDDMALIVIRIAG